MSTSEESAGIGCCGLLVGLVAFGLVLQYWLQLLMVGLALGLVALVAAVASQLAGAAAQRRRCPVCISWSNSVVLSDLGPSDDPLCPVHSERARRIHALEEELRLEPDDG